MPIFTGARSHAGMSCCSPHLLMANGGGLKNILSSPPYIPLQVLLSARVPIKKFSLQRQALSRLFGRNHYDVAFIHLQRCLVLKAAYNAIFECMCKMLDGVESPETGHRVIGNFFDIQQGCQHDNKQPHAEARARKPAWFILAGYCDSSSS